MKKHGIKITFGILLLGIIIAALKVQFSHSEYGLLKAFLILIVTSIIVFLLSIFQILVNRDVILKFQFWLLFSLSLPLTCYAGFHLVKNVYLKNIKTTTPKKYRLNAPKTIDQYIADKKRLEQKIDSLLEIKIIEEPAEFALRSFNGKMYEDSIDRSFAINLPQKIDFKEIYIDTIFYSKNGEKILSCITIGEYLRDDAPLYTADAFLYDAEKRKPFERLDYGVIFPNYSESSMRMKDHYLKSRGWEKGEYNLNDERLYERNTKNLNP